MSEQINIVIVPVVDLINKKPMTSSLNVAHVSGKAHKDTLKAIQNLDAPEDFTGRNFAPSLPDEQNEDDSTLHDFINEC